MRLHFSLLIAFLCVNAVYAVSENLVVNPGFEAGLDGWVVNNWDGLDADFEIIESDVHTGDKSLKMTLTENSKGTNIQLYQRLYGKLEPGQSVKYSFWIKGTGNAAPVDVGLSLNRAPWTDYILQPIVVDDAWRFYDVFWTPPDDVDYGLLRLIFYIRDEMEVWVDDVTVSVLPDVMGGEAMLGNLIPNGSFELGRDRWYFSVYPDAAWNRANVDTVAWEAYVDLEKAAVIEAEDTRLGKRSLHLVVGEEMRGQASSAYFEMRYGHPVTVSFDVYSKGKPRTFSAGVSTTGGYRQRKVEEKYFTTKGMGWETFSFTFTPRPSTGNLYTLELGFNQPGDYLIDGVVVRESNTPYDSVFAGIEFGWLMPDAPLGHIYDKNDSLKLQVIYDARVANSAVNGMAEVINAYGETIAEISFKTTANEKGQGELSFDLPTDVFGAFKLRLFADSSSREDIPDLEWQYFVLPVLPPLREVTDRFFGGHSALTPDVLSVSERLGLRSIRMHPPLATKWRALEVAPGEWVFDPARAGFQRAIDRGFDLLGTLDAAPDFRAGLPTPRPARTWMGWGNYPPEDLKLYEDYVSRAVAAFDDQIDHWEVWNEPDNHFLEGPSFPESQGKTKPEFYKRLVQHAQRAIERGGFDKTLLAGAVARLEVPFTTAILDEDVLAHADGFSFHIYGGTINKDRLRIMRDAQSYPGRSGEPVELWHTEGAYFPTIVTWLESPRIPVAEPSLNGDMVNKTVIRMVEMKAAHVARNYHYPEPFRSATGRHIYRNEFACGWDVAGNPLPLWAAHVACVLFLEGAEPIGYQAVPRKIDDTVAYIARFRKGDDLVEVCWADSEIEASRVPMLRRGDHVEWFDIMGNPLDPEKVVSLAGSPIYMISDLPRQ